jgi:RNA polymerase sigma-70 factor (ECF subfamily)
MTTRPHGRRQTGPGCADPAAQSPSLTAPDPDKAVSAMPTPGTQPARTTDDKLAPATAADWDRAYTAYVPCVRRYLRSRLTRPADAEDLVQETFTRAIAWAHQYDPTRGDVLAWLLGRVTSSVLADYCHAHWRQQIVTRAETTRQATAADTAGIPAQTAVSVALAAAVAALPTRQRLAVELIYLEGQQINTCAALLGRCRFTVHLYRNRALHALRAHLTRPQAPHTRPSPISPPQAKPKGTTA